MREIKFRMWLGGRFHYWGFVGDEFIGLASDNTESLDTAGKRDRCQQFTGLKDKNGRDIYEGDILQLSPRNVWVVRWEFNDYDVDGGKNWGWCYPYEGDPTDCEIVGNICENPDMVAE